MFTYIINIYQHIYTCMHSYIRIYIYIYIYIRDVPSRSGLVRSKLGAVPHETGLFRSKLQLVRSNPVHCGPIQLTFHVKRVHSAPCRSRSGPFWSGLVQSGPVRSGPVQPGPVRSGPNQPPLCVEPARSIPGRSRSGPVRSRSPRSSFRSLEGRSVPN